MRSSMITCQIILSESYIKVGVLLCIVSIVYSNGQGTNNKML